MKKLLHGQNDYIISAADGAYDIRADIVSDGGIDTVHLAFEECVGDRSTEDNTLLGDSARRCAGNMDSLVRREPSDTVRLERTRCLKCNCVGTSFGYVFLVGEKPSDLCLLRCGKCHKIQNRAP